MNRIWEFHDLGSSLFSFGYGLAAIGFAYLGGAVLGRVALALKSMPLFARVFFVAGVVVFFLTVYRWAPDLLRKYGPQDVNFALIPFVGGVLVGSALGQTPWKAK